jgi:hypothetical protein
MKDKVRLCPFARLSHHHPSGSQCPPHAGGINVVRRTQPGQRPTLAVHVGGRREVCRCQARAARLYSTTLEQLVAAMKPQTRPGVGVTLPAKGLNRGARAPRLWLGKMLLEGSLRAKPIVVGTAGTAQAAELGLRFDET